VRRCVPRGERGPSSSLLGPSHRVRLERRKRGTTACPSRSPRDILTSPRGETRGIRARVAAAMFIASILRARGAITQLFLAFITHAYAPHERPLIARSICATLPLFCFSRLVARKPRPDTGFKGSLSKLRASRSGRTLRENHLRPLCSAAPFIAGDPSSSSITYGYRTTSSMCLSLCRTKTRFC